MVRTLANRAARRLINERRLKLKSATRREKFELKAKRRSLPVKPVFIRIDNETIARDADVKHIECVCAGSHFV